MVFFAAAALLQTGRGFFTIEARVGEATGVYRGRMVSVTGDVVFGIEVEETLKGPRRQTIEFSSSESRHHYGLPVYWAWVEKGTDFLFFTTSPKKGVGGILWSWLRLGEKVPEESEYFNEDDRGVPTLDLVATTDTSAILVRAREFSRKHPEPLPRLDLEIPGSIARRMGAPGLYNIFDVPSSPELETLARRFIESPKSFVNAETASGDSHDTAEVRRQNEIAKVRATGIHALVGFKSARNVALLKRCLEDPSFSRVYGPGDGTSRKIYDVRRAAFEVLQTWKVTALIPPLEEPWPSAP